MASTQVEVYGADTLEFQQTIQIKGIIDVTDMTSCERYLRLYIADSKNGVVHCIDVRGNRSAHPYIIVEDKPYGLSVTPLEFHILVTCKESNTLKQFTADGNLVRRLQLNRTVVNPRHAVLLTTGQLVVCHGETSDSTHRVCLLSADGGQVVLSFEGTVHDEDSSGGGTRLNWPTHIAIDRLHGFIYVADYNNKRVVILNNDLAPVGVVGTDGDTVQRQRKSPLRLCLDVDNNRLYVAECGDRIAIHSIHQRYSNPSLI